MITDLLFRALYFTIPLFLVYGLNSCSSDNGILSQQHNSAEYGIDSTLMHSIETGDTLLLDSLIKAGTDINVRDSNGATPLMWACYFGQNAIVHNLIKQGAENNSIGAIPYKTMTFLGTPIEGSFRDLKDIAAGQGNLKLLKYFNTHHTDFINDNHTTSTPSDQWSPLMHAVANGQMRAIKYLISEDSLTYYRKKRHWPTELMEDECINEYVQTRDTFFLAIAKGLRNIFYKLDSVYYEADYTHNSSEIDNTMTTLEKFCQYVSSYYGTNHSYFSICYDYKGEFNRLRANYKDAIPHYHEALNTLSLNGLNEHPAYGITLNNLGLIYNALNKDLLAEECLSNALYITEHTLGPVHPWTAIRHENLSDYYADNNHFSKALRHLYSANNIYQHNYGKSNPPSLNLKSDQALLFIEMGNLKRAQSILQHIETEYTKKYGPKHPALIFYNNHMALISMTMGKWNEAIAHFKNNIDIFKNYQLPDVEKFALLHQGMAEAHIRLRHNQVAQQLLTTADSTLQYLEIDTSYAHAHIARTYGLLSERRREFTAAREHYNKALLYAEATWGSQHLNYVKALVNLIRVNYLIKDSTRISEHCINAMNKIHEFIDDQFYLLPLQSQLTNLNLLTNLVNSINLYSRNLNIEKSLWELNIHVKALTIRSTINHDNSPKQMYWNRLKQDITKALTQDFTSLRDSIEYWSDRAYQLELEIKKQLQKNGELKISSSVERLFSTLSDDEIIIDFYTYLDTSHSDQTVIYFAFVGDPATGIIRREEVCKEHQLLQSSLIKEMESSVETLTSVRRPVCLINYLSNTCRHKKIIHYSPSGLLNRLNISTLKDLNNRYFIESHRVNIYTNVNYITTNKTIEAQNDYLLLGGVQYDPLVPTISDSKDTIYQPFLASRSSINKNWQYLPGTYEEVVEIDNIFKSKNKSWRGVQLIDTSASEKRIKKALSNKQSPKVIHMATHGFFFSDINSSDQQVFTSSENPLIRSGLILAGANYVWNGGKVKIENEDGILTALEIQNLNLRNTELVVLSACETGLGEIHNSEGVFGLQRAFKLAGAQYLIMSLRRVSDVVTSEFMILFYRYWLEKEHSIPDAFNSAQQLIKEKYPDPFYWGSFVLLK